MNLNFAHLLGFFWFKFLFLHIFMFLECLLLVLMLLRDLVCNLFRELDSHLVAYLISEFSLENLKVIFLQEGVLALEIIWIWFDVDLGILVVLHCTLSAFIRSLILLFVANSRLGLREWWWIELAYIVILVRWTKALNYWRLFVHLWQNLLVRVAVTAILFQEANTILVVREALLLRAQEFWRVLLLLGRQMVCVVWPVDIVLEHLGWRNI